MKNLSSINSDIFSDTQLENTRDDNSNKHSNNNNNNNNNSNKLLKKGVSQKDVENDLLIAISSEITAQRKYNYLQSIAPTTEAKKILKKIESDEKDHQKVFEKLYKQLTGKNANVNPKPEKYTDGYKKMLRESIYDEVDTVEFYTTIHNKYEDMDSRDAIYEVINDEQDHATLDSYLFNKA